MMGLTRRQHAALTFVEGYILVHGFSPSLAEVADALGLVTRSSANRVLSLLRERGYVDWKPGVSRSLHITKPNPIAGVSDAALLAEIKRRGL